MTLDVLSINPSSKVSIPPLVSQVTATDADDALNGRLLYFLSADAHGAFAVDEHSGLVTTSALLDREKRPSYTFLVIAVDLSPATPRNSSAQVMPPPVRA